VTGEGGLPGPGVAEQAEHRPVTGLEP